MTDPATSPPHRRLRPAIRSFLRAVGVAAALVAAAAWFLPRVVDLGPVKARLLQALSRTVGGTLDFREVDLALLPRPRLVARDGNLILPGTLSVRIPYARLVPELLPLVWGVVRVSSLELVRPDAVIVVPGLGEAAEAGPSLAEIEEKLVRAASAAATRAPDLTVRLSGGQLRLSDGAKTVFRLGGVAGELRLPPRELRLSVSAMSEVVGRLAMTAELEPDSRKGRVRASLKGVRLDSLRERLLPAGGILQGAEGDAQVSLRWDGPGAWSAGVRATLPKVLLARGKRRLPLSGVTAAGTFRWSSGALSVRVEELRIASPRLSAAGAYTRSARGEERADFRSGSLDVAAVRGAASSLAGDVKAVRDAFDVLRAGSVTAFAWTGSGTAASPLGRLDAMTFAGKLRDGTVWLPWAGVTVGHVTGEAMIAGGVLEARSLSGRTERTVVETGYLRVGLGASPTPLQLELAGSADLEEARGIVARRVQGGSFARELSGVETLEGRATGKFSLEQAGGRSTLRVEASRFRASGRHWRLPFPVELRGTGFSATTDEVSAAAAELKGLDGALEGSWRIGGLARGSANVEASLRGTLGPAATRWLSERVGLGQDLRVRAPLTFARARFGWKAGESSVAGDFVSGRGTRVSLTVRKPEKGLLLERISVADRVSHAEGSLRLQPGRTELSFRGVLVGSTLDDLLEASRPRGGRAEGDFRAAIALERPERSTARGRLAVAGLQLPWRGEERLHLEEASLRGEGRAVVVDSAALALGPVRVAARGRVELGPEEFRPDLLLTADSVDWKRWRAALTPGEGSGRGRRWPVRGAVRVRAREVRYDSYVWSPVEATVRLLPGETIAEVTRAELCGLSTVGTAKVSGGRVSLELRPAAEKADLKTALLCFVSGRTLAEGKFSLRSAVSARGAPEALLGSAAGEVTFRAEEGRILRYNLLSRLFAVLNVTEILRGRLPDLTGQGFGYSSILAKGKLEGGVLSFSESVIDGASAKVFWSGDVDLVRKKLDLTVVVAPFKTVDAVLAQIPVLKGVIGRSLISVPLRVTGDLAEPTVSPLSPGSVGEGVLAIMQRTLTLPFKLVQPLLPGSTERDPSVIGTH